MKNIVYIISAIAVIAIFLPSFTRMQDLRQKNAEYEEQIEALTKKNQELEEEKRRLIEDPEYVEKVAREKMGIVREGEVVFKLTPEAENK